MGAEVRLTACQVAELIGAKLHGAAEASFDGVDTLREAAACHISFLANPRYHKQALQSRAGALIASTENVQALREQGRVVFEVADPNIAFQRLAEHFLSARRRPSGFQGVHPTAVLHDSVRLGSDVTILPYAVIDAHVVIGDGSWIGSHVSVGPGSTIGANCKIHSHAVLRESTVLGDSCIIQPGAVLGSCGYGYNTAADGRHEKLEQLGNVELGDAVEVGANTTVDRGRFRATSIGSGTKIDNLVQVAHNVRLGKNNLIVSQVGLAGSSSTGDNCVLGGQAALVGHVAIASGVILGARGAASKDIKQAGVYSGAPAQPHVQELKQHALLRQLLRRAATRN